MSLVAYKHRANSFRHPGIRVPIFAEEACKTLRLVGVFHNDGGIVLEGTSTQVWNILVEP